MIHEAADRISNRWIKRNIISAELKPCYMYGMEIILSTLIGIAVILIISVVFRSFWTAVVFLVCFIPLRQLTGGYHASSYFRCNATFIGVYALNLLAVWLLPNSFWLAFFPLTAAAGTLVILQMGPVEHVNKPLSREEKRRAKKRALLLFLAECALCGLLMFLNFPITLIRTMIFTLAVIILFMPVGLIVNRRKHDENEKS